MRLHDFFPTGLDEEGDFVGEDVGICTRWRAIGGRVWTDPAIHLQHVGAHTFIGDPMAMFAAGPVADAA